MENKKFIKLMLTILISVVGAVGLLVLLLYLVTTVF